MSSQRQMRFSELIRSLISECILVEDFYNLEISIKSITVSFVKMSKDLRMANVYIMPLGGKDHVNIIKIDDYQLLPLTCKQVIWHYRDEFDIFLFGENDHLFVEHHIDNYLRYTSILPNNRIAGLIQYEENETGKYYPAYHAHYDWDYNSVEEYGELKFAHFTNIHQATFILTQEQLLRIGQMYDFTQFFGTSHYSVKCKVNTDIYQFCGMKKLICISEFDNKKKLWEKNI